MLGISPKTMLYGAAGALGGSAAWAFVPALSGAAGGGLGAEILLGALTGMCIGGFIWSHEAMTGKQFRTAIKRAAFGAAAGILGGALGAGLGSMAFSALGRYAADLSGFRASLGVALSVALGWAMLGATIGVSGGIMIRSRDRARYGLIGGSCGGFVGGLLFNALSATNIWSALAGLFLLGLSIGAFISLVEEAFVSAKIKVIKGRHVGREFPLIKELNIVGRDDRSDVCLSGAEGVAVRHAGILRKNGRFFIETDEEGKAVYVNQQMTRNSRLADGDVIRVGSILLLFSAMRKAAVIVLLIGLSLPGSPAALAKEPASAQITQFDLSGFPTVRTYVSVLDAEGQPVRGLRREITTLRENGRSVAIDAMTPAGAAGERKPVSLAIVMDQSGSMAGEKIEQAKASVLRLLSLLEQDDRVSLLAFSDSVQMLAPLSTDRYGLHEAVQTVRPDGHTALYDGIAQGVDSVRGVPGRRAVIVLSDGIANRGSLDIGQAIDAAVRENVSVFVIGLGDDVRTARLERIAEETGGSYFFTPSAEGLQEIYGTIGKRILNEYVITYRTGARSDYLRNVSLTLVGGRTAARSYFQPRSSLFGAGGRPPRWAYAVPLASLLGLIGISFRKLERHYPTGHLSLVRGQGTKKDIDISSNVTIGRDERSTLGLLKDDDVAKQHAEITKENGRYVIADKGAPTGTFVNRQRVRDTQELKDGDVITVGKATIVFSEESAGACSGCGGDLRPNAKFCAKCGQKAA